MAAAQVAPDVTRAPSTERLVAAVRDAAARGAQLVVLPELAPSGYCFLDREEAWAAGELLDGASVTALRQVSLDRSVTVVAGLPLREGDTLFNAAVVLEDGEVLGVYRKSHLWAREKLLFTPGEQGPLVVTTRCGVLAVVVCYDLEFPEWVRVAAVAGAELLCVPTNWPRGPRPAGERPMEVLRAMVAASTNRMAIAVCDRCGDERGVTWVSGSAIASPDGWLLAGPPDEAAPALLTADVDLAAARDKALGPRNDALADRRTALYG